MFRGIVHFFLALTVLCSICQAQSQTQAQQPSVPGLDLSLLFGGRTSHPILKFLNQKLPQFQQIIDRTKESCLEKLQMPKEQRPLIRETQPTDQEKRLIECVLKGVKIMSSSNNRIDLRQVEQLTSQLTEDNKMIMALCCGLAQSCNRGITTDDSSEAANQLNQCISRHFVQNNIKLTW